jgi:hypothetical protein
MARDDGGGDKEIVFAMILFRVCTGRGYIKGLRRVSGA